MYARSGDCRGDARRKVAIGDQPDARAGFADIGDQLLVPRTVEHHHDQVVYSALQAPGNGLEIVLDRGVQIHGALGSRTDDDLFHVAIRCVQQSAALGGRQHGDGAGAARGTQVGALQRIDRNIHGDRVRDAIARAHLLADEEHGRFVALPFADDDGAVDRQRVHRPAHGFHRRAVGSRSVAHSHGAGRGDGGFLHHS